MEIKIFAFSEASTYFQCALYKNNGALSRALVINFPLSNYFTLPLLLLIHSTLRLYSSDIILLHYITIHYITRWRYQFMLKN